MVTEMDMESIRRAIERLTSVVGNELACSNDCLDRETGLAPLTVDEVIHHLWRAGEIEGLLHSKGRYPNLHGIRIVDECRPRRWGRGGAFDTSI